MKTPKKIHGIAYVKMDKVENGAMTFSQSPTTTFDKEGNATTVIPALIQFLNLGDSGNDVATSTHGQSVNCTVAKKEEKTDGLKNHVFEEKVKHYQDVYNSSSDDNVRGKALSKLADMYTCAEYRSLIRQRTRDGKHDQVKLIISLFGQYVAYRDCMNDLQTARENAYSVSFKRSGQIAKTPHVEYIELVNILKESIKKSAKMRDNDDSMEIYMAVCCAILETAKNGKLDLLGIRKYKDTDKNVYGNSEKVKHVDRVETNTNYVYRMARRAIDSHASVKALINGVTYTAMEDEETKKTIYTKSAKYADIGYDSENSFDSKLIDALVTKCKATKPQAEIASIILRHNGNITQREIAEEIGKDVSTVRDHLKGLRKKFVKLDGCVIDENVNGKKIESYKIRIRQSAIDGCITRWIESNIPITEDEPKTETMPRRIEKPKAEKVAPKAFSAKYECYEMNYYKMPYGNEYMMKDEKPLVWSTSLLESYWKQYSKKSLNNALGMHAKIAPKLSAKARDRKATEERKHNHKKHSH